MLSMYVGDDRKGEARKVAVEKYRLDLTLHVKTLLEVSSSFLEMEPQLTHTLVRSVYTFL